MALNNLGLGFLFTAKDLASGVMGKVRSNFESVEGSAGAAGKMFGGAFRAFGTGVAIMSAGMAGFALLSPAIDAAAEIGKAIKLVATEADLSIFPMEKMHDVANKLALSYGSLPVEQAKAMYKAVALGANDAAKSTAFLSGVNLLATAGNADLEMSANALGGALNAYGASFDQATKYSDAFFTAMKMGNTTVQDLANSVGRVTSSAANLNVSIDEILGAVSVMTNKGVQASEAVSGLKEALANVVHPSADAKAEAARLGIQFTQASLRAKGLQGFLQSITGSSKFTAESFSKLFTSVEGANAIVQVAGNHMQDYNAAMEGMAHKAGATQKGFDIMSAGLGFQKKLLAANKEILLATIGDAVTPFVTIMVRGLNLILQTFNKIPKPIVAFMTKIMLAASSVLVLVGGFIAAKAGLVLLILGLKAAGITIGGLLTLILPAIAALGILALAFVGLKYAYEHNLGGFRDFVENTVAKVKLAFEGLAQLFTEGGFSGDVRNALNEAQNKGLKNFLVDVFVFAKRIQHLFEEIGSGFERIMNTVDFKPLIDAFTKLGWALGFLGDGQDAADATDAWNKFGAVGERIGVVVAEAFDVLLAVITGIVDISRGVVIHWDEIKDSFSAVGDTIGVLVSKFGELAGQLGYQGTATTGASNGWVLLGESIAAVISFIGTLISISVAVVSSVVSVISGIVGAAKSAFDGFMDIAQGIVMYIGGVFTGDWAMAWTGAKMIVFGFVNAVIGILLELVGAVAGIVDSIAGMFGKSLGLQKGIQDFKQSILLKVTEDKKLQPAAAAAPLPAGTGGVSAPVNKTPGAAPVASFSAPQVSTDPALLATMQEVAKNTAGGTTVNATLTCDGDTLGKLVAKGQKGGGTSGGEGPRNFTPAPPPTG